MNQKYADLVTLFEGESYMKALGCVPLWIDDRSAIVTLPLLKTYANFSDILWGGLTAALGDIAAPIVAFANIDRTREIIRLHRCETTLLKPIPFEDGFLALFAEITDQKIIEKKGFPRRKLTVTTHTFSGKTGEEKAVHTSFYDVISKTVDQRLISRERSKITP